MPALGVRLLVGSPASWKGFGEVLNTTPPVETGDYFFESSSLEGGGFQNCLAVSPYLDSNGNRPYLLGADVSGPFRSVNRGALWLPVNNGSATNSMRVGDAMWDEQIPGKAYIFEDGGIHRSTDWAITWAKRPAAANMDANGARTSPEHPRQTGNLMAQENSTATKYRWAGTETLGLRQSIDDFGTWRSTVLTGHRITSIALDPNNPDSLYATVSRGTAAQNGLWHISNARAATMTATKVAGYPGGTTSPVGPEEVIAVNQGGVTQVIVAAHTSGVLRYTPSTGTWATLNTGLNVNGTAVYQSVAVDPTNSQILYCGHWHPVNRNAIYRSTNGGGTWISVTGPNPVAHPATGPFIIDWRMFGTTTRSWLADIPYHNFAGPNADWLASQIAIDPDVPTRVLAVGRGGCWWGTLEGTNRRWQPANHGLMVTVCMAVAVDDLAPGRTLVGNMDYTALFSTDDLANTFQSKHPDSASTGDVVTFDMANTVGPSTAFYGASERGSPTGVGAVFSSATPQNGTGTHWVNESAGAFNSDVMALAVGRNASSQRVILAGVSQAAGTSTGGLWRKVGATWTQLRTGVPFALTGTAADANMGCLRYRRNSTVVYALDSVGVWRSGDAGATWVQILSGVSATYGTYNGLELDPTNTAIVYVSSGGTVRRINNASTSTGVANTNATTIWSGSAGNIALHPDGSQMFINIRDGRLMKSTAFRTATTQAGAAWTDIATSFSRNSTGNIRSLVCSANGVLLTADNGSGALRGYEEGRTFPVPPAKATDLYWQLSGTVPTNRGEDVYDIDGFDNTQATFTTLNNAGKYTIAYFSAGTAENWRSDYASFPAGVKGIVMQDWPGEFWLDVRQLSVLRPIMEARADLAKAKGAKAIEWDNIDVYLQTGTGWTGITAADQIAYCKMLADICHKRGLAAIQKNLPDQVAALQPYFDGCLAEQPYQFNEVDAYMAYPNNGKPLWCIEYGATTLNCADALTRRIYLAKYPLALNGAPTQVCAL